MITSIWIADGTGPSEYESAILRLNYATRLDCDAPKDAPDGLPLPSISDMLRIRMACETPDLFYCDCDCLLLAPISELEPDTAYFYNVNGQPDICAFAVNGDTGLFEYVYARATELKFCRCSFHKAVFECWGRWKFFSRSLIQHKPTEKQLKEVLDERVRNSR